MPMPVSFPSWPNIFCNEPDGNENCPVILGAGPLQNSHHLQFHVFFGDEEHVAHLALFQLGRLVPEHRLVRVRIA